MIDPLVNDALLDGRSVIIVGAAPLADKVTVFQSLVDAVADMRKLAIIDDRHILPTVPPSADVLDVDFKGVDTIHHEIRDDGDTAVAVPNMRRGDIMRMLMDFAGQENGQVLLVNDARSDAGDTLRDDLPVILLKSSPSGAHRILGRRDQGDEPGRRLARRERQRRIARRRRPQEGRPAYGHVPLTASSADAV
ncbi:hypothetical protein [uncultured Bifidobacterium sp.]|uniref:hypothetical protein n=1 Tax=uncultured Bifidobacterium sp. TaxID=165187 RepID=UPI00258C9AE5|nr:hypothetical protein [uncultured Bifidobacterium sp.]